MVDMKIILGGGIIALFARDILGSDWTLLPIGKSRYYSYSPPLADDYIVADDDIIDYVSKWATMPLIYKNAFSYGGNIIFNNNICLDLYLTKYYNGNVPSHTGSFYKNRLDIHGYGHAVSIYSQLQDKYKSELVENNNKYGMVNTIDQGVIKTSTDINIAYDKIISTLPLDVLLDMCGVDHNLISRDVYYYHVRTEDLDFEGATSLYVVDNDIKFHKVRKINRFNYIFESCNYIDDPGQYFFNFMNKFDLIAETKVENVIPCGNIPDTSALNKIDICCVGSNAQWDDCMDLGSCIKRLIKYA